MILTEYWIPSQNRIWANCPPSKNTNTNSSQTCGIANVLQFSIRNNKQVWFTEWSENKIGKLDTKDRMPFSVTISPQKELTLKRGEGREIKVKVTGLSSSSFSKSSIHMIASGTLTPTGDLGNSTGSFSQEGFSINAGGKSKQILFTFKPSLDLKPGQYVLMIGAENEAVTFLRAIKVNLN
jgi:virginiamycin B lyase